MRPGIKRGIAGVVLAGLTLLASACANPPGTDGNLVNEWPEIAAPEGWVPKADTCHKEFAMTSYRRAYTPVSCTTEHRYETVHLGEFTGDAAKLTAPPTAPGNADLLAAYKDCDAKTTAFVGGEWRSGRLWIGVSVPSPGAWEGGARWYRCEVSLREDDPYLPGPANWSKSLKGEFSAQSELKYGCYDIPSDEKKAWVVVACTAGHNAEFVGTFPVTDAWATLNDEAVAKTIHTKCRSMIAGYVGVPDNGDMKYRTGTYYHYPSEAEWADGDHAIRCHLWLSGKTLTRSLKGTGNSGLPIN
ncbi:septum formation family protein [Rhizocola hellebori]|nr:septum formation family protein [Rhizocola hellebori]